MADHKEIEVDLVKDGVLWYLNRVAFHPRGLALSFNPATQAFSLWGDMDEPWAFTVDDDNEKFKAFDAALDRLRELL